MNFVKFIRTPLMAPSASCMYCKFICIDQILFWQLDGELFLAPGFAIPPNMDYNGYHVYIDEQLPPESPNLYGLHPNAEIGFLTATSENLFKTILELQPRDSAGAGGGGQTREEKVKQVIDICYGLGKFDK